MARARAGADDHAMDAPPIEPPPLDPGQPRPADPGPPPAASPPPRRLARRSDERLLGGVAGGVAEYLGVDVVLVRLGFVVTAFFGGLGVIAYVLGWVVLPLAPSTAPAESRPGDRKQLFGYTLVAVGLLAIGGRLGWSFKGDGAFWPLALIALGAAVLWLRTRDVGQEPVPPVTTPRPAPGPQPAAGASEATTEPARVATTAALPAAPAAAPPTQARSYLGATTWCSLLILAGGAWLLDASGAVDVDLGVVCALALALVGGALVVSAWFGRARGLIALGIPLVLVVGAFGLVDVPLHGGIGDPTYHPRTVAAVDHDYTLAIGNLSVDLRDVDFSGTRRHVHAQLGIGQLNVTVPTGVRVVVDGHAGVGGVTAFGRSSHECCPTDVHLVRPGVPGGGTVFLDADVGAGHVEITRREESFRAAS
jgi:phage shock protein PspC (stress-responsive transcriptional regulator)